MSIPFFLIQDTLSVFICIFVANTTLLCYYLIINMEVIL
nr:MAG TPA: hypothetical protein [Caudoviricetes sp.]